MAEHIALFGEAEKGAFQTAYYCENLQQLVEYFGNPPEESFGLHFAIQALHYGRSILFFRVEEEGFSLEDYRTGAQLLAFQNQIETIAAIGIPGVGDSKIFQLVEPVRSRYHSILLTTEADLYDYLSA